MSELNSTNLVVIRETGVKAKIVGEEHSMPVVEYNDGDGVVSEIRHPDDLASDVLYDVGDTVIVTFSKPVDGKTETFGTVTRVDGEFRDVSYEDSIGEATTTQKATSFKPAPKSDQHLQCA